jgi:uncharacterized protein YmfQ (DUF2313 family)
MTSNPISLFTVHSQDENAQSLANFLPGGLLFEAKNIQGSNLRNFLFGLAAEFQRCEQLLSDTTTEYDIRTTNNLISEWEQAVGIPDCCFTNTGSIEERRANVLVKIASPGVSTAQDFIDLAAILGYTITIERLDEVEFYPPYDVPFTPIYGVPESRYVWIVVGDGVVANVPPYDVPFSLGDSTATLLQCVFNQLKSAQTLILYQNS